MSKICPNCLHPVRTGANYCGYCGTSLVPTPHDPAPTMHVASKQVGGVMENAGYKAQRPVKGNKSSRAWVKVPITLLVLVLFMALAMRFWPQILILLSQALPLLQIT